MKRKIKAFLSSMIMTGMLIAVVFGLATVDIRTRGIAGYMGDSAVTAFSNGTKQKITKLTENGEKTMSGSLVTEMKDTITAIYGLYDAVILFFKQ